MGHNPLNFAGQPLEEGQERLVVLVRDRPQKAFFIKVVDTQVNTAYNNHSKLSRALGACSQPISKKKKLFP